MNRAKGKKRDLVKSSLVAGGRFLVVVGEDGEDRWEMAKGEKGERNTRRTPTKNGRGKHEHDEQGLKRASTVLVLELVKMKRMRGRRG